MGHGRARDQYAPNVYLVYTLSFSLTSMRPSTEWWASCLSSTNDCLNANGSGSRSPFFKVNLFRLSAPALFAKPLHYATLFLPCCAHTDHSCLSTVKGSIYTYIYISLTSSPSFHWMSLPIYPYCIMCMMLFLATVYPSLSLSFSPFLSHVLWLSPSLSLSHHSLTHSLIVGTQRRLRKRTAINGRWHLFVENLPKASLCTQLLKSSFICFVWSGCTWHTITFSWCISFFLFFKLWVTFPF